MQFNLLKVKVIICLLLMYGAANGANVDTVLTHSDSMNKNIKAVVISPNSYKTGKKFPVLYLLHGAGGNYSDWVTRVPAIKELADQHQFIIVCPDGNVTSWYFDSPVDPNWKYETYVASELVKFIDQKYHTVNDRKGRAITGLSMGGHGAFYLAIKHQDVFGAVGSLSGGVDIKPFPKGWDLPKRLGTIDQYPENWRKNSVIDLVYLLKPNGLAITFDCGTADFFYAVNLHLHEELTAKNIPHEFTIRPGAHTWQYWANSIKYQTLFFAGFFMQK